MFDIYLTDVQQHVQFQDYPGEHPVKFILNFKKIFPSVMELMLPVLPENENLEEMTWESCNSKIEMSGFSKVKMSAFRICAVAIFLADGLICWCLCRIKNLNDCRSCKKSVINA